MEVLIMSLGAAAAMLFTLNNAIGIKNIAKHSVKVDVACTLLFFMLFAGTSTGGVFTAMWAGLIVAIFTKALKSYWIWASAPERGYLSPLNPPIVVMPTPEREAATIIAREAMSHIYRMSADRARNGG